MPITDETYERVALEDEDEIWELVCGKLRKKPIMTVEHNHVIERLFRQLARQLDEDTWAIRTDTGRVRVAPRHQYVPDLFVLPLAAVRRLAERPRTFESYPEPVPLVVEVWSRRTGAYDVETKFPDYQRRGDAEIWRIHPYQRTLTAWVRQPGGSYAQTVYRGGTIQLTALPGVTIDIDALFTL